jgi:hypothetical protein
MKSFTTRSFFYVVMPKPITVEEREKIIKHIQNNKNKSDIAR